MSRNFELMIRSADAGLQRRPLDPRAARLPRPGPGSDDREILPLVDSLFLAPASRPVLRSVMFTSVEATPQSASVCVRVARALAAFDAGAVCLVDANLSSPWMHRRFRVPQEPGVADVLEHGRGRLVTHEVEPGLSVVPAGRVPTDARGHLPPDRVKAMTGELCESFDWVLVDIGPIGTAGHPAAMAEGADAVVLVVTANRTRRAVALGAAQALLAAGARVLGTVLADRTFPIPETIYRRL